MVAMGVGIVLLGMGMVYFRFGLTFVTVGTMVTGLFLLVYGITLDALHRSPHFVLSLANKLMSLLILLGIVSFIWVEALVYQSLHTNDKVAVEYTVILGAGVQRDQPSLTLKRRLDKGIEYLVLHPDAKVVVSGGMGSEANMTEAEVMQRYLVSHGIAAIRILKEDQSKSSDENLKNTRELLDRMDGKQMRDILIVTSDYHMFRSKYIAGKYYAKVYGLAAETPSTIMLNYAVREYLAVVKMLLTDNLGLRFFLPIR